MKKHQATILLGSNIGDKRINLSKAIDLLKENGSSLIKKSSIYESEAWGNEDQDTFYNQVIVIKTFMPPIFLMKTLLKIERKIGRLRKEKWGPRTIDLDLLFYDHQVLISNIVTIPHPEIQNRKFTLIPLVEICPQFIHPVLNQSMTALLSSTQDTLNVKWIK